MYVPGRYIIGLPLHQRNATAMSRQMMITAKKVLGRALIGFELGNEVRALQYRTQLGRPAWRTEDGISLLVATWWQKHRDTTDTGVLRHLTHWHEVEVHLV